jgi:hypothetical protein
LTFEITLDFDLDSGDVSAKGPYHIHSIEIMKLLSVFQICVKNASKILREKEEGIEVPLFSFP